jgi:hypothetical protein
VSHNLAHSHGLSSIELEHNLKFKGKLECLISEIGWSNFDRFSLHRWCTLATKIGPTSTQAASGRGKARTIANSGANSGGDE